MALLNSPQDVMLARAGAARRLVIGARTLPRLEFAAPDAPAWTTDAEATVHFDQDRFEWVDAAGPVLSGHARVAHWDVCLDVGEAAIMGFGAASGATYRNDSRFRLMTIDTLMYAIPGSSYTALPFFIARRSGRYLGVLLATTYPLDVDVAHGTVQIKAPCQTDGAPIDLIVFRGSLVDIVRTLADVVGRSLLPPAWALGFHQSRWSYKTAHDVLKVGRQMRRHDLPADVVHLDIHYMDRYRVFTFHPQRFPDPARLHAELGRLALRTMAIVDPGVSVAPYPVHDVLRAGSLLLTRKDGTPYEGRVWPGATVFPDFTQAEAREAWASCHAPLVDAGVAGIWNDMNDPVLRGGEYYDPLVEDVHHRACPHRRARNLYANGMAEATRSGLATLRPGRRPFVLSRSGFLGIQRDAAIWTGDNHSTWAHLRENLAMVLNLGLSGVALAGADVGGFARGPGRLGIFKPLRPSAELFLRWMELGAWMPFFRVHCTLFARSQDPWSFGRRALQLNRRLLRQRYRWLLHLYRLALEAHEQGLPLVRPLCMHYEVPDSAAADQFLVGSDVLVAPVLERGQRRRSVWLPAATEWIDWRTGRRYGGGRRIQVEAPLGATPVFVWAGTPVFLAEPARCADETLRAALSLDVTVPAAGTCGRGSLFLDDGESAAGGRFLLDAQTRVLDHGALQVELVPHATGFVPVQREIEVRVPVAFKYAFVDGQSCSLQPRSLLDEDCARVVATIRVPIESRTLVFRHDPPRATSRTA